MASLGSLVVSLAANTAAFTADLGKAAHEASKNMGDMQRDAERAGMVIGVALAAAAGSLVYMTKQAINTADSMYKLSQSTGVAIGPLSELAYVGSLAGVGVEQMSASISKLNKHLMEMKRGDVNDSSLALDALGISAKNADGSLKSADQVIEALADSFASFKDGPEKSAIAMMFFGKSGAQMVPMLNQGSEGIRAMRAEARELGLTLDTETGKAAEEFNDNLQRLSAVNQGLANSIMKDLIGPMKGFTDQLVGAKKNSEVFVGIKDTAVGAFQAIAIAGASVVFMFKNFGDRLGGIMASLVALANLDFEGFAAIDASMKESTDKARLELSDFIASVMDIGKATEKTAEIVVQASAPIIQTAAQLAAAKKAEEEVVRLTNKGWVDYAEAVLKAAEAQDIAMAKIEENNNKLAEAAKAKSTADITSIEESMMGELALEDLKYEQKLAKLQAALANQAITEQQYNDLLYGITEQHYSKTNALIKKGWTDREKFAAMSMMQQAQTIFGELASITAGVAQHNRALFEINKVAGIANAVINTFLGVSGVLAKYPGPIGWAMAAVQAAAGLAQVMAIQNASFGGGGGAAPSISGSTPADPTTNVPSGAPGFSNAPTVAPQSTIINLHGEMYSRQNVRDLIEAINENQADGGRIILQDDSLS